MVKLIPFEKNLCSKYAEKMLSIKINSVCNGKCNFCVDKNGRNVPDVNVDKISKAAIEFTEYKTIIITGGEPFINFSEVVKLATKLRPYKNRIVLNTNGTLLSKGKIEILNDIIDELQVSIHHYEESRNAKVFGRNIQFENIKTSLENRKFILSINSTFNNEYSVEEMPIAVDKMIELATYFKADRLRLTELKKVDETEFISADKFFNNDSPILSFTSNELINKGCTYYFTKNGIDISVKRLCKYAKGKNAIAFSCCFVDINGQNKIDIETKDTFKVIYGDGFVSHDWIFKSF